MENVRKHRRIKLITTEARRNYLVSQPNQKTYKQTNKKISYEHNFSENLIPKQMKKHKYS